MKKRAIWRVELDGENRIILTNNRNASYYEYRESTREEYLAAPVTVAGRALDPERFAIVEQGEISVWFLNARDRHGKLLTMYEYTVGPDPVELRADMLDEAKYLAGYLNRVGIGEARDGPHIDANMEREPGSTLVGVEVKKRI